MRNVNQLQAYSWGRQSGKLWSNADLLESFSVCTPRLGRYFKRVFVGFNLKRRMNESMKKLKGGL